MRALNDFSQLTDAVIARAAEEFGTPVYLYDEKGIIGQCQKLLAIPNAYGMTVRYAMKANSSRAILRIIAGQGLGIDASSINEARRANLAGIDYGRIMLTTQEVPLGQELEDVQQMMRSGMKYNVCSLRQLQCIGEFAAREHIALSIRVHPGVGSGESASRNTGDNYSCFGVHLSDIPDALEMAGNMGVVFDQVHVHIGSGADPVVWQENIDREMGILEQYFPDAVKVSFGGGLKQARMPEEQSADIEALGSFAKERLEEFYKRTGRKLHMEIEPGTYVIATSGYIITEVIDIKRTGADGLHFFVVNGGMELNTRPLLYASRHPFYMVSRAGKMISSEFDAQSLKNGMEAVIVGRCCESGDSQCLDSEGYNTPRPMGRVDLGDYVVIGGTGAYCASMSPMNYNSHVQATEVLLTVEGQLRLIRKRQSLEQMLANEV